MNTEPFEVRDRIYNDYLYSYGGISPFFRTLKDDARLTGTRCAKCGKVWCPPRIDCSDCYSKTAWVDLPGTGTVRGAIEVFYVPSNYSLHKLIDMPYVLALIQPDGADTCIYNTVFAGPVRIGSVKTGLRVRAVFREKREGRLTDFYFVPLKGK